MFKQKKKYIKGIFLTHSHYDHIYGLNTILKKFPQINLYCNLDTKRGLSNPDINLSYMYDDGDYIVDTSLFVDVTINPVMIFEKIIEVIPTPGHDIDCTSYIIGHYFFTGDSYNSQFPVFTKWRRSNVIEAEQSIEKILHLAQKKHLRILPGHYK